MKYALKTGSTAFVPWLPSTWPEPPVSFNADFARTLKRIIKKTMLDEIENVISDARAANGSLEHRGHVVALAILCAIDSIAAYSFSGRVGARYKKFISTFFPISYRPFAKDIYEFYRNSIVHSWNLFQVGIWPGNESIAKNGGALSFGLINCFDALNKAVGNFLSELLKDPNLQQNCLKRYSYLKHSATP